MDGKHVRLAPGELFYLEGGGGRELLFLHGAIATAQAYLPLLELLARNHHVIAPIHPGHGQSFAIPSDWKVSHFAGFYRSFLADLGFTPQVLIGHSFGGTLALLLAAARIGKQLVVMDAPCLPFLLTPAEYLQAMADEAQDAIRQRPPDLGEWSEAARAAGTLVETVSRHPEDIPLLFREGPKLNISGELGKIRIPVEIFWGEHDQLVPVAVGQQMRRMISQANLTVFSGREHNYPVTDPEFTYQELQKVLRD